MMNLIFSSKRLIDPPLDSFYVWVHEGEFQLPEGQDER